MRHRFFVLLTGLLVVASVGIARAETAPVVFLPLGLAAPQSTQPLHSGEGTYYFGADGSGNCLFDPIPGDLMVAAMNTIDYNNAALCGAYVAITGPAGSVTWTAVQIRNHRNPIAKLEYLNGSGSYVEMSRLDYNYFLPPGNGLGTGPYTFRVTDTYGNTLIDSGIPFVEDGTVNGAGQFPQEL